MDHRLEDIQSYFTFQISLLRLCQNADTEVSKLEQMIPAEFIIHEANQR